MKMKECVRCKMAMDVDQERHIKIKDNDGKKNLKTLWYHKQCWHQVMTGKAELNNLISRAQRIMGFGEKQLGISKEEYTID